uniref:HEPN family nuclease n=1 Tax=Roseihalotalea indica TaxID=2867963 RepID=A0AA49GGX0_9BACT|nr:HEPN family nuclease [Tunicatimonas sp. TK19036]
MGNYRNIELDFITRTLALISQYEALVHRYEFKEQYNYTLLLNCLLGLVVMPKERTITHIPADRITQELRREMGLVESWVDPDIITLRQLIVKLRHAIAHFDIEITSDNQEDFLIDKIVFRDSERENSPEIARFSSSELLPFIRYYANWLISNIERYEN